MSFNAKEFKNFIVSLIMIVKLKGKLEYYCDDFVDLETQGVVYRIFITEKLSKSFNHLGEFCSLHIYEIIKEDARLLFGFREIEEREIFSDLLIVQGVGGKMALNILSQMSRNEIIESISSENHQFFTSISGVGNKLAMRIVNELKEKIKKKNILINPSLKGKTSNLFIDLVSCLENLGYPNKTSQEICTRVINENKEKELQVLIPIALKYLTKPRASDE